MQPVKTVPCPRCGAPAAFDPSNKWRPFCSERCKVIDLGDWAAERYRVAGEPQQPGEKDPDPSQEKDPE